MAIRGESTVILAHLEGNGARPFAAAQGDKQGRGHGARPFAAAQGDKQGRGHGARPFAAAQGDKQRPWSETLRCAQGDKQEVIAIWSLQSRE